MKKYFLQNKFLLFCQIAVTLMFSASVSILPLIIGSFIENFASLNITEIAYYAAAFVLGVGFILLFEYLQKICYARFYKKLMLSLKNDLFGKIYDMTFSDYYSKNTDYYINLFIEDAKTLYSSYFDIVVALIISIVSLAVYSAVVFYLNWIMALAIIATALLSLLIPKLTGKKLSQKRLEKSDANRDYIGKLKDLLAGFTANNLRTAQQFKNEHNKTNLRTEEISYSYRKYNSFVEIFGGLSLYIMNIVVFVTGMILINAQLLKISELVVLISFTDIMVLPIRDIIFQIIELKSSTGIKNKLQKVLNYSPKAPDALTEFSHSIELVNINYEIEQFTLSIPSLVFNKGKKYAIVGKSGSGKTTLLKIIMGQYENYAGNVTIDGKNAKDMDLSGVISEIGQNAYIFNGSAEENITLFGSYSNNNLSEYIEKIKAQKIIRQDLGEFGKNISGGERNKISILRAICKGCKVLVCDEMFSSLDEASKRDIADFLFSDNSLTVISVTHDISPDSLAYYDEVIVINNGAIIEIFDKNSLDNAKIFALLKN